MTTKFGLAILGAIALTATAGAAAGQMARPPIPDPAVVPREPPERQLSQAAPPIHDPAVVAALLAAVVHPSARPIHDPAVVAHPAAGASTPPVHDTAVVAADTKPAHDHHHRPAARKPAKP